MWVRSAAIRPVPPYARVAREPLTAVEDWLAADDELAERRLDESFARFEEAQPALARRVGSAISATPDEVAAALGYFLGVLVWLGFDRVFGARLGTVSEIGARSAEESFALDEELRKADPAEAVDSDEIVAMEQPHVVELVHEHLDAALEAHALRADVDAVHRVYRVVLVEVLALSYAVSPPPDYQGPSGEHDA